MEIGFAEHVSSELLFIETRASLVSDKRFAHSGRPRESGFPSLHHQPSPKNDTRHEIQGPSHFSELTGMLPPVQAGFFHCILQTILMIVLFLL